MSEKLSIEDLRPVVTDAATEFGIPEDSIWRKLRAENSGSVKGAANLSEVSNDAVSPKNARGIMQMTPVALQDVINAGLIPAGTQLETLSPKDNIRAAAAYIKRLRQYSTDPAVEDAMYNYGPKARFRMDELPNETQRYVEKSGAKGGGDTNSIAQILGGLIPGQQIVEMLLKSTTQQNDTMARAGQELSAATTQGAQDQQNAIDAQKHVVADAAANAGAKAGIEWQNQKVVEGLQSLFHMDPSDANNEIAVNITNAQRAEADYGPARAEYDQINQINPLTSPLDYIFGQIRLPQVAAKVNSIANAEETAIDRIKSRTELLKAVKSTVTANTADQLLKINQQQAQIDAHLATSKLDQESAKIRVQSAANRMQELQVANMIGDNTRQTLQVIGTLQDREEAMKNRKDASDARLKAKKTADEEEALRNEHLKTVSEALGLASYMTNDGIKQLHKKEDQQLWDNVATSGQFGHDVKSSTEFYLVKGNKQVLLSQNPSTYKTADNLYKAGAGMQAIADHTYRAENPVGKALKPEESKAKGFELYQTMVENSVFSPTTKNDLSSATWDKTYNPYKAPFVGFSAAIDTFPQLQWMKDNLVKKSIDALVKSGAVTSDNITAEQQQQILSAAVDNVAKRAVNPVQAAAEISQFFKAATTYNQSMNKYDLFGLPKQNGYLFTVAGSQNVGDNDQRVDLMDQNAVQNMLVKKGTARGRFAPVNMNVFGVN